MVMQSSIRIVDLQDSDEALISELQTVLFESFKPYAPEWLPTLQAARRQVLNSFALDRRSRVCLGNRGELLGWIGAIVDDDTWEIHPIVVSNAARRQGIGKELVKDIEALARQSGAVSVWAGTSDETHSTSFSQYDLYRDLVVALQNVVAPPDHPINFWLGVGYSIVGVMPDEEGLGEPGIHFAKRLV